MKKQLHQITSESVSEGHPDKVADQVSDAILDAYLAMDQDAKVACECLITHNHLVIAGEVMTSCECKVDPISIAKGVIKDIGYVKPEYGFDVDKADYSLLMHTQSREINDSVSGGGAGDQGMMFGYACDETEALMPLPIYLAHRVVERLSALRRDNTIPWLLPDAKSQVTVIYEDGRPVGIDNIVVSTQHMPKLSTAGRYIEGSALIPNGHYNGNSFRVTNRMIKKAIEEAVIKPLIKGKTPHHSPRLIINPSGSFLIGGPAADTGLTGRKIIVDNYGSSCPHGGGAFSGKDPSKVDRSAAYMARYIARHLVAAKLTKRCTVQLSYAISEPEPTSLFLDFHDTGVVSEETILPMIQALFDLSPNGIIKTLNLKRPIYRKTAAYGHFGRNIFPWEQIDQNILNILVRETGTGIIKTNI